MKRQRPTFGAWFAAAAFAEAGEFHTAAELVARERRIVVALERPPGQALIDYSCSSGSRLAASVEMMVAGDPGMAAALQTRLDQAGLRHTLHAVPHDLHEAVIHHANHTPAVLFVALEQVAGESVTRLRQRWRRLHCPLVIPA